MQSLSRHLSYGPRGPFDQSRSPSDFQLAPILVYLRIRAVQLYIWTRLSCVTHLTAFAMLRGRYLRKHWLECFSKYHNTIPLHVDNAPLKLRLSLDSFIIRVSAERQRYITSLVRMHPHELVYVGTVNANLVRLVLRRMLSYN